MTRSPNRHYCAVCTTNGNHATQDHPSSDPAPTTYTEVDAAGQVGK